MIGDEIREEQILADETRSPYEPLEAFGWDDARTTEFAPFAERGYVPARVTSEHRGGFRVVTADGEIEAVISGRFRHEATGAASYPAVGDWLAVERRGDESAVVRSVLERRSRFSRGAVGPELDEQIVAANVDVVFLVASLNRDFNLRRLERYLALAWSSGALPVIVLNKADLSPDVATSVAEVGRVAGGAEIHAVSAMTGSGLDDLRAHVAPGRTVALLGSSGVGKSTLVNVLLGEERQDTGAVREADARGRHTTVTRQLLPVPSGGLLIDTPGMRSIQLWDADEGLGEAFDDIEALAQDCRFSDCTHTNEPGCAVQRAISEGQLHANRLESMRKLQAELDALEARRGPQARAEARKRFRQMSAFAKGSVAAKRGEIPMRNPGQQKEGR